MSIKNKLKALVTKALTFTLALTMCLSPITTITAHATDKFGIN